MKLSLAAEEVALFFAQMLDHEYTTKKVFRENFFKDWRKVMSNHIIHIVCCVGGSNCVTVLPLVQPQFRGARFRFSVQMIHNNICIGIWSLLVQKLFPDNVQV